MSPNFITWAKDRLAVDIQAFGDDPYGVVGYDLVGDELRKEVAAHYVKLHDVAVELGTDFWVIAADECNEGEILRLKSLLYPGETS